MYSSLSACIHVEVCQELEPIFKLIGFWRKLELRSWAAILERTEQEICDAAIASWFYLRSSTPSASATTSSRASCRAAKPR